MSTSVHRPGPNQLLVSTTVTGVEVRNIGDPIGNALFATRNYSEGDVIFEECPLVSCQFLWNASYGYLSCDLCMRPLETAEENVRRLCQNNELILPYPECSMQNNPRIECPYCGAPYCSEMCRSNAWDQYHEVLCLQSFTPDPNHPLSVLQETWKKMHYPPESSCIMLLARIFATVRQSKNKEDTVAQFMKFCHRTINEEEEIAHKLLGSEFLEQLEILRSLMNKALGSTDVQHWLTPEGFKSLVALVGTNGQGIGTSSFSEWVRNVEALENLADEEEINLEKYIDDIYEKLDETAGTFLNNEGSGLYQLQSSCNHSCDPNATPTFPFNNFKLVMEATKDIKEGEEICISYLDNCNLHRSRHSRIKLLRENYIFTCRCPKCIKEIDDPDVTSDEDMEDEEDEENN